MVRSLFGRLAGPSLRTRVLWLVLAALVLVGLAGWLTINRIIDSLTFQFGTMIAERQVQYDRYRGMAALGREISLAGALSRSPAILEWFADENGEEAEARGHLRRRNGPPSGGGERRGRSGPAPSDSVH